MDTRKDQSVSGQKLGNIRTLNIAANAPVKQQEQEIASKLQVDDQKKLDRLIRAERKGAWWQGFAVAAPFFLAAGVALALLSTTSLIDPIGKIWASHAVSEHVWQAAKPE